MKTKPILITLAISSVLSNSSYAAYTANVAVGTTVTGETVDGDRQAVYGTANNTTIISRGYQNIGPGGIANDTIINGGSQMVLYGGTANNTVFNTGSFQINGIANDAILNGGTTSINVGDNGLVDPYTGGKMNNTTINAGAALSNRFGVDTNTVVNSGGRLLTGAEEYGRHVNRYFSYSNHQ